MNDAERLCRDPTVRWMVGGRTLGQAASASQGRFETEWLTDRRTRRACRFARPVAGQWIDGVHRRHPPKIVRLDMDSSMWEISLR